MGKGKNIIIDLVFFNSKVGVLNVQRCKTFFRFYIFTKKLKYFFIDKSIITLYKHFI